jgi:hypothetical protein
VSGRNEVLATINSLLADWQGEPHDPTTPAHCENRTIPQFLGAMAAWLESYENAWINMDEEPPTDGWVVFNRALSAAAFYE